MRRHTLWWRTAMLGIAFALAPAANAEQGPSLAGKWEGTLKDDAPAMSREVRNRPAGIRTVLTIAPAAGGTYTVTQVAVDVGKPIELTDVVVEGNTIRWKVPALMAAYEGKLSDDGAWIKGKWTHFRSTSPVNFKRASASP
ncbi:MAG TPA: hypothetical protein VL131_11330 [Gammaproteobacteria bacterium]|nr:hypothetical protein [Gammaproteobacteria bacterium]